jgi:hypothetical protein
VVFGGNKKHGVLLRKPIGRQPAIWNNEDDTGGKNSVARVVVELGQEVVTALNVRVLILGRNVG